MPKKPTPAWVPTRLGRRGAAPALLGELLVGAENFVRKQTGVPIPREEWRGIVGARIASRTRVGRLQKGVLTIQVASSAWSSELSFLKADILRKLQGAGHDIVNLRFVVDKWDAPSEKRHPLVRHLPTPVALPAELEARLKRVDDPNLRAAIADAAKYSLADLNNRKR